MRPLLQTLESPFWPNAESRQKDRDLKREAALRTAAQLFVERGVHRTTLSDVAERLNITKPALYYYFKNKNEIVLGCYQLGAGLTAAALDAAEVNCKTGAEKARAYIRAYLEVLTISVGTNVTLLDDRDLDPEQRAQIKDLRRGLQNRLRSYLREGMADGSLRVSDVTIIANTIGGAINGLSLWYHADGALSAEAIIDKMSDYLMQPLLP